VQLASTAIFHQFAQKESTLTSPNDEQMVAIKSKGGVLLQAGAGSGKTFVLVNHLIFLIEDIIEKDSSDQQLVFEKLKKLFQSMVLMTFTRKAAGELSIRVSREIESKVKEHGGVWSEVQSMFSLINITTIHGFCSKLLREGYAPAIRSDFEIISEVAQKKRIEDLFLNWVKSRKDLLSEIFLSHDQQTIGALYSIFQDPSLRIDWQGSQESAQGFSDLMRQIFELHDWKYLPQLKDGFLSNFSDQSDKKWFGYLDELSSLLCSTQIKDWDSYQRYLDHFVKYKGVRAPTEKSGLIEVRELMAEAKELRELLVKYADDFGAYLSDDQGQFVGWNEGVVQLIKYIETHYHEYQGLTYADLEYFVLKALEHDGVVDSIKEKYQYFIIDEYQDTSEAQYSIVHKLIGGDYDKAYFVGDVKQAIYGFRGGELNVFLGTKKLVSSVLELSNNYRSTGKVINFNNNFFRYLFKLGAGFKGVDKFEIKISDQICPIEERSDSGHVTSVISPMDQGIKKPTAVIANRLEAKAMVTKIEEILESKLPDEDIAILYKNLAPSSYLIKFLIEKDISFTAQIKIPSREDPVIGIFYLLVSSLLDREDDRLYFEVLTGYLKVLDTSIDLDLVKNIEQWGADIQVLGLYHSFQKFIYKLGISNSNFSNNLQLIKDLCLTTCSDIENVWRKLKTHFDGKYSFEFEYGARPEQIKIMTTHASKGLEFDHVLLGGIYSNGRTVVSKDLLGSIPGSFKWKKSESQKDFYMSPAYILERQIKRKKDFSEDKRLFYVACTRAKDSLTWIDLSINGMYQNSWIGGLRSFFDNELALYNQMVEVQKSGSEKVEDTQAKEIPPLFHISRMGLCEKLTKDNDLVLTSDLSVTRLTTIVECPRKFYLQNICRIDQTDLEKFDLLGVNIGAGKTEGEEVVVKSSAERGSQLHLDISKMIKNRWVIPLTYEGSDDKPILEWVKSELTGGEAEFKYISEKDLKFPVFGHMVSGTPDLVVLPKDKSDCNSQIWDFKTGRDSKEEVYLFQLYLYALGHYELNIIPKSSSTELVIAYLDKRAKKSICLSYEQIVEYIFGHWKKLAQLDQVNVSHCQSCIYQKICT
jgi:ATP-dependent helicase/nuclease subunit A